MDGEILERLILDRSLGALSADCEALLAEYLTAHPEKAAYAEEMTRTTRLARAALSEPAPTDLPALATDRLMRSQRDGSRSYARWASGLAAALLLGFGAHAFLFQQSAERGNAPHTQTLLVQAEPAARPAGAASQNGFWSARRLYERTAVSRPNQPENVIWDSPARLPRLGDKT